MRDFLLSVVYNPHRHLRQITPVAVGIFTLILAVGPFFTPAYQKHPSPCMGVFLFGTGSALILEGVLASGVFFIYSKSVVPELLSKLSMGAFLIWMADELNLLTPGTVISSAVFYVLILFGYALSLRKYKRYSLVALGSKSSSELFEEKFKDAGAKLSGLFKKSDEGRHFEFNRFLVNLNITETADGRCLYALGNLTSKSLNKLQKIFADIEGITSIRTGMDFHTNCSVTNFNIERIFNESTILDDAYIYGNGLFLTLRTESILSGVHGSLDREIGPGRGQLHRITVSFGLYPQKKDFYLNLNTHNPQELMLMRVVDPADGEEKVPCPQLLGKDIYFDVVHEGPLETFGRRLIFHKQGENGQEHFMISYSFPEGIMIEALSKVEALTFPVVSVAAYLDYWSSFTFVEDCHDGEKAVDRPNQLMAPRTKFLLSCHDKQEHSQYRIGIYTSEQKAVAAALNRADSPVATALNDTDPDNLIYQVNDEDGELLFATDLKSPVSRGHFLSDMLHCSTPFWNRFFNDGYAKIIIGSYVLGWITLIPLFSSFMKEHAYLFFIYMFVPIAMMVTNLRAWGEAASEAESPGGRFACFFLGFLGTMLLTAVLALISMLAANMRFWWTVA